MSARLSLLKPFAVILLGALFSAADLHASNKDAEVRARVEAANAKTALEQPGVKPWHLKIEAQLYRLPDPLALPGAPSTPGERGTIEEWWASPTQYKVIYNFPSYQGTEGANTTGRYRSANFKPVPEELTMVRREIVHPMPTDAELVDQNLEIRKQDFGGGNYDCILVERAIVNLPFPPIGSFPAFCLKSGTDDLVATIDHGREFVPRLQPSDFEGKTIVRDLIAKRSNLTTIVARIATLEETPVKDADYATPAGAMAVLGGEPIPVPASVMKSSLVHKVGPHSDDPRQRPSGVYVARVVIGTDGHVVSAHTVSGSPNSTKPSLEAIEQYQYKPYLLNGQPSEVVTTVTIEY